jgi:simple sugar transport system ATP-binding protein
MRNMKADNKSIVIITHKLHEVKEISDRVVILRKGKYIGEMITSEIDEQQMTDMMVGRQVSLNIERKKPVNVSPRIIAENMTVKDPTGVYKLKNVSFTANAGEILGIAGISGCGQKELLEAIAGLCKMESGSVCFCADGKEKVELNGMDPETIRRMGISLSFVPEDRLGMGLVANMDIADNMMLRSFRSGKSKAFTDRRSPRLLAEKVVNELEVDTPGISTPVRRLSGGNVQKVLVGREIASDPSVLMTAYAVRGLDINSSYIIYDLLNKQKEKGTAVIFVGEDLDVLLELSDRILVLCGGEVSGIVDGPSADKNTLGLLMTKKGGVA